MVDGGSIPRVAAAGGGVDTRGATDTDDGTRVSSGSRTPNP